MISRHILTQVIQSDRGLNHSPHWHITDQQTTETETATDSCPHSRLLICSYTWFARLTAGFSQARCSSGHVTNRVKALKGTESSVANCQYIIHNNNSKASASSSFSFNCSFGFYSHSCLKLCCTTFSTTK